MVASAQQWAVSSRATATATIVRRLPRRSSACQRACRRRQLWSAPGADCGWLSLSAPLERCARAERAAMVPGSLDEQPARVAVAGLGDRALTAPLAGGIFARDEAEEGAEALRPEARPVADLDRERERGQRRDAAQTAQPANDVCERRLRGELGDCLVERIAARLRLHDDAVTLLESEGERARGEALPAQPGVVGACPGARVVDETVAEKQLREPMTGPHQIAARVLAGANEITCRLLIRLRHPAQPPTRRAATALPAAPHRGGRS